MSAVKFFLGIDGAASARIMQFVLAGLATTRHLTVFLANSLRETPCFLKMSPFIFSRSPLDMPTYLGKPPMNKTMSAWLKSSFVSEPVLIEFKRG